jgi:tetratricopeptide (TPR) repeat protein
LLTPSALERCDDPGDWLRREIETALFCRHNIVPLMLDSFDFGSPAIARYLTGALAALKRYNGLRIVPEYFGEAMERLRRTYLNVPLTAVLHPPSISAKRAATEQKAAAETAPVVLEHELMAQELFERGFGASDLDEKLRLFNKSIQLKPQSPWALNSRGNARRAKGDLDGALQDYNEVIHLRPDYGKAFNNRGVARLEKGDAEGALRDLNEAVHLMPEDASAFYNRGNVRYDLGDIEGALRTTARPSG